MTGSDTDPPSGASGSGRDRLDDLLMSAHARNDGEALAELYAVAADQSEAAGQTDATCFYLTHAYVFALQFGLDVARDLQMRLWRYGREVRPDAPVPPPVDRPPNRPAPRATPVRDTGRRTSQKA